MRFVFLGPVFCRQLPSDSASPRTPLLLANLYFCLRGSGLPPYSSCACRAHTNGQLSEIFSDSRLFYIYADTITIKYCYSYLTVKCGMLFAIFCIVGTSARFAYVFGCCGNSYATPFNLRSNDFFYTIIPINVPLLKISK